MAAPTRRQFMQTVSALGAAICIGAGAVGRAQHGYPPSAELPL